MLAAGRGAIVFTAGAAGLRGSAAGAACTAAKHGIVGLVKSLAVMHRGRGIRANAIAPGATATGITYDVDARAHGPGVIGPGLVDSDRIAFPEEQAAALAFLASDAARHINGAVLPVDDGWCAV